MLRKENVPELVTINNISSILKRIVDQLNNRLHWESKISANKAWKNLTSEQLKSQNSKHSQNAEEFTKSKRESFKISDIVFIQTNENDVSGKINSKYRKKEIVI